MNSSSIVVFKASATLWASFREGLYFPCSKNTIVSLLTPTLLASPSWVRLCLARNSFILVFIELFSFSVVIGVEYQE